MEIDPEFLKTLQNLTMGNGFQQESLLNIPVDMLAKICSYLPFRTSLVTIPSTCKSLKSTVMYDANFIKMLNSELIKENNKLKEIFENDQTNEDILERFKRINTFLIDQKLLNSIVIESGNNDLYRIFKILKINHDIVNRDDVCQDLELIPLDSSSKDYNQSVHRTINRFDDDQFWSSSGSDTPEANEWLTYKIPIRENDLGANQQLVKGCAIIQKFVLAVFDPKNMQYVNFKYAPKEVQIEVGNTPDKFDYKSKIFPVNQDTSGEQVFDISPDLCCGRYIRIKLIGKPHKQNMDQKYYVAVSYFGIQGMPLEQIRVPDEQIEQEESKMIVEPEEMKSSLAHQEEQIVPQSSENFAIKLQNLILQSNKNSFNNQEQWLNDPTEIKSLDKQNYLETLIEIIKSTSDEDKAECLFKYREQILLQINNLVTQGVLNKKDIVELFDYSVNKMGISGITISKIVFKYMIMISKNTEELNSFGSDIFEVIQLSGGVFLDITDTFLNEIIAGDDLDQNFKMLLMQNFWLFEHLLKYLLKNVQQYNDPQKSLHICLRFCFQKMQHGRKIPLENWLRIHFKKFGYTSEQWGLANQMLSSFHYGNFYNEVAKEVLDKIKKEIDEARELQMSSMYC